MSSLSASSSSEVDTSGWLTFYPNYCNSEKTVPEGRRIGKATGVAHPTASEMAEAAKQLQLPVQLQMNKAYSRDWLVRGRIKVLLKKENGTLVNSGIRTKRDFLKQVCKIIPTLKTRTGAATAPVDPVMALCNQIAAEAGPAQPKKNAEKDAKKKKKK
ncbi:unnamed protein product [Amoebophrya sp. A25]|nr:unnamed protein product [Amoebophrya sp. A25]|eukprot:GSA25T00007934001.1